MPENRNWKGRVSVNVILIMSDFWVIYGIAGILGFQVIRSEYKGHDWTKTYVRLLGASWLMLGVPWLLFDRIAVHTAANIGTGLLCACAGHAIHCVYVFYRQKIQKYPEKRVKRHRLMFHEAVFL